MVGYAPTNPNPRQLRVISTARTADAINEAAKQGLRPLVKPVVPGSDVKSMFAVYQHRKTGEIYVSGDVRGHPGEEYELAVDYRSYYPYSFAEPFAAYLIPDDLRAGEEVWLEDLIEDVVGVWGNQGYQPRLAAAEAS
jgi:hypothetical protein